MHSRIFGLDVIRAAAIALVLVAHFAAAEGALIGMAFPVSILASGFFGVELFFALSGFLIGGLLIEILQRDPSIRSWIVFMTRRWMRTLPLYCLWVLVLFVFLPPPGGHWTQYLLRYLTFTQNFALPMMPGGWGGWFGHSWSLAIEEWFYLLFSAVLLALAQLWPRRAMAIACGIFISLPLVLRFWAGSHLDGWDAVDENMRKIVALRLDAIAYGVLAAWLCHRKPDAMRALALPLAVAGATLVLINWYLHANQIYFYPETPLMFSLPALAFALLLPFAGQVKSTPRIVTPIIRWLSTRSYGLYIVHFSALQFFSFCAQAGLMNYERAIFYALGTTVLIADLSFRFFESPILRRRPRQFTDIEGIRAASAARLPG